MAGEQYLSSTTKFVKNARLAVPSAPVAKVEQVEPRKGKSPPATV
jgi:hypothetical protein